MNAQHKGLFLALLIARLAGAEPLAPDSFPSPAPSAAAVASPAAPEPTPEKKIAGNAADQQDAQPAASPVAAVDPPHPDLLSTLANRHDQPLTLTIDEADWPGSKADRDVADRPRQPGKLLAEHLAGLPHCQQFSFLALVQVLPAKRPPRPRAPD